MYARGTSDVEELQRIEVYEPQNLLRFIIRPEGSGMTCPFQCVPGFLGTLVSYREGTVVACTKSIFKH